MTNGHLNGLEPKSYLRKLLTILPGYHKNHLADLMPENWKIKFEK
ncbi:hypothetical protein Cabys_886 [Caldithrix abyssi DSM 13497]|uniref:Transposase IS66 C-terminal domain-containing protein n=1 Tax=Caldithrix abyssi DSM 13497 TaxID=880073 RepID=A0A1J1C4M5_CALAY|nr:hypothetical protein Cabys_886 [Caldithrix abyssi DSM 13497]